MGVIDQQISQQKLSPLTKGFQLQYTHPCGKIYQGNSLDWLASLDSESVDLVFADPPYNIKKAEWDNFENQEKYIEWSIEWISQASRILKITGSLYICGFSEILADLKYPASKYFKNCRWLIWHYKNKANLGNDWGRSHESIIHFRKSDQAKINIDDVRIPYSAHTLKYPTHPQAETSAYGKGKTKKYNNWTPHPKGAKPKDVIEIPTTCNGMGETTPHPTQKPEELLRKFVLASSQEGDLIIDPFSGSGTTLVVAEQLNRRWMGCDLNIDYNSWAIKRLENVRPMTKAEWIIFDRKNSERRESIR
ncbi:site-specific DNA-methyltransferase [Anabaena sp. UHCC 0204]|uniref:DNA-methyltransferase n=1 Tax=Anabaena sp. UHCC 0204 TaxID=2590009 RepID=UPI001445CDA9|nr:site-specific DNA-methyltransferase [Anabaena sp. UHCC 0204]MTJ06887.1 site-specific DNA-methyltransferase [Anabaena sp. UHCC 0204]